MPEQLAKIVQEMSKEKLRQEGGGGRAPHALTEGNKRERGKDREWKQIGWN